MDKLSAMRAFVRVIEAGTFTKAADSIGVPKAQVTRLVQSLERTLRTQLLNRTTRRVVATPDGAAYYESAVRLLDEIDDAESRLSHAVVHPGGKLRIAAPTCIANNILLPAMDDFCARYPDIQVDVRVCNRPVDLIGENVDCALRVGQVTNLSLVARRLGDIGLVLCASPMYLEHYGVPYSPSDLEDGRHRVISPSLSVSDRSECLLRRGKEQHHLVSTPRITVDDAGALLSAALAGLGIVPAATFHVARYVDRGALRLVLPEWNAGSVPLHVTYSPARRVSAKLRVFIDWTVDLVSQTLSDATSGQRRSSDVVAAKWTCAA
jgi:LysR family transcriptional regulator for bpeEF and oprC